MIVPLREPEQRLSRLNPERADPVEETGMRFFGYPVVVVALSATLHSTLQGQALDAAQVLAATREALGGEKKLSGVKTFTVTGRTRQVRGNNLVPIEFEITCELPDKFVRIDEFPAQDSDQTRLGFKGDELIQFPPPPAGAGRGRAGEAAPPPAGRAGGGPPANGDRTAGVAPANPGRGAGSAPPEGGRSGGPAPLGPAQQRVASVKQDFVRLTLGMFATSFPSYPLTFKYLAQGEAPEGKADILDVAGPVNFSARFVVQRDTHLPVMLMWQVPATTVMLRIPGQPMPGSVPPGALIVDAPAPPPASASEDDRTQYAATVANLRRQALTQAKPIDYRMYYADFRDVDGFKMPFRIRRAIAGETIEETTFDRIRINARVDPRKFEAPK